MDVWFCVGRNHRREAHMWLAKILNRIGERRILNGKLVPTGVAGCDVLAFGRVRISSRW